MQGQRRDSKVQEEEQRNSRENKMGCTRRRSNCKTSFRMGTYSPPQQEQMDEKEKKDCCNSSSLRTALESKCNCRIGCIRGAMGTADTTCQSPYCCNHAEGSSYPRDDDNDDSDASDVPATKKNNKYHIRRCRLRCN